ncbi:MAG: aminoacyl-tRNA hydrolase [Rhodobacteraceae bacterium]|nr:aminoacyl-tRNA hydrolase [Paracoccaceae bacterium]
MRLFVGLGNPGPAHAGNRHNIGFMALDRIAAGHGFPPWRARFQGLLAEGRLGAERVALLKPQTYMNLSGQAVGEAMRFFRLAPAEVVVFHDEIDLAPGKVRLKAGGGHAGHNGLRSIHAHIGEGYGRVRIGVGHPGHRDRVTGHVLADFGKIDAGWVEDLLAGLAEGAPDLAAGAGARFLEAVARRLAPAGTEAGAGPKDGVAGAAAAARPAPAAGGPKDPRPLPGPGGMPPAAGVPGGAAPPAAGGGDGGGEGAPPGLLRRLAERFR